MRETMHLYHNPFSRGRIARWMLEEVEATYEVSLVRFDKLEHRSDAFLRLNPMGKIPTLVVEDPAGDPKKSTVVTEAAAICAYLADREPQKGLAPPVDSPERATYYRWLFFGAACVEAALLDRAFDRPLPEREGALGYGDYERTFGALEVWLSEHAYLTGDAFTAADLYLASQLNWGVLIEALAPTECLQAYLDRCTNRDSYRRAQKLDDALAKTL